MISGVSSHRVRPSSLSFALALPILALAPTAAAIRATAATSTATTTWVIIYDRCLVNCRGPELIAIWIIGSMAAQAAKIANVKAGAIPRALPIGVDRDA